MKIASRLVDIEKPPLVIAEIGINHGGDIKVAKSMARLAAQSGAECIKHQTHFVDDEMTAEAKTIYPPNAQSSIWEVMEQCALDPDDELELKQYAESLGLIYISTPFSRRAADFLAEIEVPAFKIGSGEADNLPLIRHIAGLGKPVIMSTGMQTIESLGAAVDILRGANIPFALLECTNLYPSPPEIVALQGVTELREAFPDAVVGFSDHSVGPHMALASIPLGACILERHFTDTRYRSGPDVSCSMDPVGLREIIDRSREIHTACRNRKHRSLAEEDVYRFARASVVADRDIQRGQMIGEEDIWVRRPGTGEIPPNSFDSVIGRRVVRDIKVNEQLRWSDLL